MKRQGLLAATMRFPAMDSVFPTRLFPNFLGKTPPNGKIANLCKAVKKIKKRFYRGRLGHSNLKNVLSLARGAAAGAFLAVCPDRLLPPPG